MPIDSFIEKIQASKHGQIQDDELSTYEIPLITVDCCIFTVDSGRLKILLIQRKLEPYQHSWGLPGGFLHIGETLEEAAERRLYEETNVTNIYLEQLHAFDDPERDSRARVITVGFYALCSADKLKLEAHGHAEDVGWYCVSELPELAFDHQGIIDRALKRLKNRLQDSNVAFQLLSDKFTLSELQKVYELILETKLDKRNFRKKMLATGLLEETNETKMEGYHRPAQLYAFKEHEKLSLV